jgi:hypothetical protein
MWTFYVELAEIVEEAEGHDYPNLMFVQGQVPDTAPDRIFKAEDDGDAFDDSVDIDDYEDLDFNENWN